MPVSRYENLIYKGWVHWQRSLWRNTHFSLSLPLYNAVLREKEFSIFTPSLCIVDGLLSWGLIMIYWPFLSPSCLRYLIIPCPLAKLKMVARKVVCFASPVSSQAFCRDESTDPWETAGLCCSGGEREPWIVQEKRVSREGNDTISKWSGCGGSAGEDLVTRLPTFKEQTYQILLLKAFSLLPGA